MRDDGGIIIIIISSKVWFQVRDGLARKQIITDSLSGCSSFYWFKVFLLDPREPAGNIQKLP